MTVWKEGRSDGLDLGALQKVLKRKNQITDRIINDWVTHSSSPNEAETNEEETLRKWFFDTSACSCGAPVHLGCNGTGHRQGEGVVRALALPCFHVLCHHRRAVAAQSFLFGVRF